MLVTENRQVERVLCDAEGTSVNVLHLYISFTGTLEKSALGWRVTSMTDDTVNYIRFGLKHVVRITDDVDGSLVIKLK